MNFVLITGPMFSGKTEELLRIKNRYDIAGKKTLVLKPVRDTRHKEGVVVSHDENACNAIGISKLDDVFPLLENYRPGYDALFIDEFQFLKNVEIGKIRNIVEKRRIDVYVCGLVLDSYRVPFDSMVEILPYADIMQLTAVCDICGDFSAKFTYRSVKESEEQVLIGGKDIYNAVCINCLLEKEQNEE